MKRRSILTALFCFTVAFLVLLSGCDTDPGYSDQEKTELAAKAVIAATQGLPGINPAGFGVLASTEVSDG